MVFGCNKQKDWTNVTRGLIFPSHILNIYSLFWIFKQKRKVFPRNYHYFSSQEDLIEISKQSTESNKHPNKQLSKSETPQREVDHSVQPPHRNPEILTKERTLHCPHLCGTSTLHHVSPRSSLSEMLVTAV